jgi:hypothetical protein
MDRLAGHDHRVVAEARGEGVRHALDRLELLGTGAWKVDEHALEQLDPRPRREDPHLPHGVEIRDRETPQRQLHFRSVHGGIHSPGILSIRGDG